jgi:hypothetical protein
MLNKINNKTEVTMLHKLLKCSIVMLLLGLFLTLDLSAYTKTVVVEDTVDISSWVQLFGGSRVDTIYVIVERVNLANVWITFGGVTLLMSHASHPSNATLVDSVNIFLLFNCQICMLLGMPSSI